MCCTASSKRQHKEQTRPDCPGHPTLGNTLTEPRGPGVNLRFSDTLVHNVETQESQPWVPSRDILHLRSLNSTMAMFHATSHIPDNSFPSPLAPCLPCPCLSEHVPSVVDLPLDDGPGRAAAGTTQARPGPWRCSSSVPCPVRKSLTNRRAEPGSLKPEFLLHCSRCSHRPDGPRPGHSGATTSGNSQVSC